MQNTSSITRLNLSNYKQYTTYNQNTKTLTIKDGITEISNIFENGYILDPNKPSDILPINSLTLLSSLVKIDDGAFHTSELKTLIIPDKVTYVDKSAFKHSRLTKLTVLKQCYYYWRMCISIFTINIINSWYISKNLLVLMRL